MDWLGLLLSLLGQGGGGPPANTLPPPGIVGPHDWATQAGGSGAPAVAVGTGRLRTQPGRTRYGPALPPQGPATGSDPRTGGWTGNQVFF